MSKYGIAGNAQYSNMTDQEKVAYSLKLSLSRVTTDAFRTGKEWYTEPDLFLASNKNKILSKNIEKYSDISNYYVVVTDPFTYKKYITNINAEDIVYTHGGYKLDDLCPGGGGNYMVLNIETDEGIRKDYSREPAEEDFDADGLLKRLPVTSWCFYKYWLNGITGWGGVDENGTYPDKDNIFSAQLTLGSDGNPSGTRIYSNVIDDHTLMAKLKDYIPLELINPNNVPFDLEQEDGISNDLKAKILPHIKINLQVPTVSTAYGVNQVLETELNVDNIAFYNPLLERSLAEVEGYNARGEGNGYWVVGTSFDQNLNFINITPKFGTPTVDQGTMFFSNMSGFLLFFGVPSIIDGDKVSAKCPPMVTAFKYTGETFADGIISQLDAQPDPAVSKDKDLAIWDNTLYRCENGDVSGNFVSSDGKKQVTVAGVQYFSSEEDLTIGDKVILKSNIATAEPSSGIATVASQVLTTIFTLKNNEDRFFSPTDIVSQKSKDAVRKWVPVGGGGGSGGSSGGVSIQRCERLPPPGLAKDEDLVIDATNTLYSVNIDVADVTVNGWQIGRILQNSNGNTNKASLEIGSDDFYFTMDADIIINHESYKWTEGLFLGSTISVAKINGYVNRFITTIVFVGKGIPGISNGIVPVTQVRTQTKTWQVVGNTIKQETNLDNIENPDPNDLAIKIVNTEGVNDTMWRYTSEKKWEIVGTYIQQVLHLPSTNDAPVVGDLAIKTGENTLWRYGKNNEGGELWGEVGKNQLQVKMENDNYDNDIVNIRWVKDYLQHQDSIINATTVKIESDAIVRFNGNHNICFAHGTSGFSSQKIIYASTNLSYSPTQRTLICDNFVGNASSATTATNAEYVRNNELTNYDNRKIYLTGSDEQNGFRANHTHDLLYYVPLYKTLTCPVFAGTLSGKATTAGTADTAKACSGTATYAKYINNTTISVGYNTDSRNHFGKATIGYNGYAGYAAFCHVNFQSKQSSYALMQGAAGEVYLNAKSGQSIYFRVGNVDKMTLLSGGYLGIGKTDPRYPLEINAKRNSSAGGIGNRTYSHNGFLKSGPHPWDSGGHNFSCLMHNNLAILGSYIVLASDKRIKKNILEVPDNLSLQKLRDINCCYYGYIDTLSRGDSKVFGFIAQQVREHMPMAVTLIKNIIPNEMRDIENPQWTTLTDSSGNNTYKLTITDLQVDQVEEAGGTKYKFYVSNDISGNDEVQKEISSMENDPKSFIFEEQWEDVFLYGKEIDDFHTLNKQALFSLNFSATQQIDKNQIILQQKVATLEGQNANLLVRLEALEKKVSDAGL